MIAGFNRGYNGFQQNLRTCTPPAASVRSAGTSGRLEDLAGT